MENSVSSAKKPNINNVEIGFKITSVNEDGYTCNVQVSFGDKTRLVRNMMVTGLLLWSLKNKKDDYVIGKEYSSLNTEQDWRKNPFQLIRYRGKQSDEHGPELLLACVNERNSLKKIVVDVFGDEHEDIIYRGHNKYNYKRYRDLFTVNKQ